MNHVVLAAKLPENAVGLLVMVNEPAFPVYVIGPDCTVPDASVILTLMVWMLVDPVEPPASLSLSLCVLESVFCIPTACS